MKPLKNRLLLARDQLNLTWEVIERDYILSWILAGITHSPELSNTIVFKGGTALKKCYFGNYRMSEDLDFSNAGKAPVGNSMLRAIINACDVASNMLNEFVPIEMNCERYIEREPHPGGQEAFIVKAKLPWHRQPHVRIMIEITMDEPIITSPIKRPILHSYGENINAQLLVYSLEEIISEKLRAILQQQKLLEQRGWVRSRARDYYDLWHILKSYGEHLNLNNFSSLLHKKCAARQVMFETWNDFFPVSIIKIVEESWNEWLQPLVKELPASQNVIADLKIKIKELLSQ